MIHAEETLKIRRQINRILAHHSGQPEDVIGKDTDRDNFMSPERALEYGLIDKILTERGTTDIKK
jgi:ATP-dependent Clp protease protease subunit